MSCDHCVAAVRRSLDALPGVRVDTVGVGAASVTYDPARTNVDQMALAIADEGYEVTDRR